MTSLVETSRLGRVAHFRLNRPDAMNALSWDLLRELGQGVRDADADADVVAVFISSTGPVFSTGGDLLEAEGARTLAAVRTLMESMHRAFGTVERCTKPVVAIVDGLALAGGLEPALVCDLIVATERARFGDAHIKYGLAPGAGGSVRLPQAVGTRFTRWLMYSGETIDAQSAADHGLVQKVIQVENQAGWMAGLAEQLSRSSSPALAQMKRMTSAGDAYEGNLGREIIETAELVMAPDGQEGFTAFKEKRAPRFPSAM